MAVSPPAPPSGEAGAWAAPLDRHQIQRLIPHRPPLLLLGAVLELEPGAHAVATVDSNAVAPLVTGHFPGDPVVPGVLLLEAGAQLAALTVAAAADTGTDRARPGRVLLAGASRVRFRRVVHPEEEAMVAVSRAASFRATSEFALVVTVGGRRAAEAQLSIVSGPGGGWA